jgi:hypothetical protein
MILIYDLKVNSSFQVFFARKVHVSIQVEIRFIPLNTAYPESLWTL